MSSISRATLPNEFFDITSDMLLVQPEPQYLHGALLQAAMGAAMAQISDAGLPFRMLGGSGAAYGTVADDRLMLEQRALSSEAAIVVPELGRMPGHTVRINRPSFTNSTYTQASREIPTGATISTTPGSVGSQQVAITLKRFGGPYDNTAAAVTPLGLEKFDASLSLHKLASIAGKHLKRDYDRFIDAVGVALWASGSTTVVPAGFTDENSFAAAGDGPMDYETLTRVESTLDAANIPRFMNGKRICVLHPRQIQQLKVDPMFQRLAAFHQVKDPLFTSYVATVGNLDVYVSSTLTTNSNTNSITVYRGQAFGPGMVGCGLGRMPEVMPSSADNYGETVAIVWLMYAGFSVMDNTFGCVVSTS